MQLWMSAEISESCSERYFEIRKSIENIFNQSLSKNDYGQSVESWDYIVILLPRDMEKDYDEIMKYDNSDKSLEFRLRIDSNKFLNGDRATQMKLVCESLLRSLDMPIVKKLSSFNNEQLKKDFTNLGKKQN